MCLQSCSFLRLLRLGSCLSLPGSVPVSPAAVGLSLPEDGEGGGLWALVAWRLAAGKAFLPSALFLFFGISSSSLCTPRAQCCKAHNGSLRLLLVFHPLRIKFPFWLQNPPALPPRGMLQATPSPTSTLKNGLKIQTLEKICPDKGH